MYNPFSLCTHVLLYHSTRKNNIMASASCIGPDQPNQARHIPSLGDRGIESLFMKQKIHRRRKVSARVRLRGMLRLIRIDTLRRGRTAGFLAGRLILQFNEGTYAIKPYSLLFKHHMLYRQDKFLYSCT